MPQPRRVEEGPGRKMEGPSEDNLTTRSLLKGILETEPVRTAVKNPSKRRNPQPSTSYAHQADIPSSPSMNLRSKMKERVRRSLRRSTPESPVLKRKVDTNSRAKGKSAQKGSHPLMDELDDITPRTLLKKIIQNEDEVSIIVSQRSKVAAATDDRSPENSLTAQLSGMDNVNLSLPELQDTGHRTILRKTGKKRKLRVSDFEKEVDERLPKERHNDNVSLDSFTSSSSVANSYTFSRPFETKLDLSAAPESTFRKVLLRRPNKVCLVSLGDFEQGVEDKYQLLKGSQECFIQPTEDDGSDASSNNLALMNTELYTQSLRKDANATKSENRKQKRASKHFLLAQDEIKEANNVLLEAKTRKRSTNDRPTEENVIKDFGGDRSKVMEDSDEGGHSEDDGDGEGDAVHVSGDVVDDRDEADYFHESGKAEDDRNDGEDDDAHASGELVDDISEDESDVHASGEVDSDEDEADVLGSGDVADDSSEDRADVHGSGEVEAHRDEDEADVLGSGDVADDSSEDEADDGHGAGEDGAVVLGSGEVADNSSEDEADDGHGAGEADVANDSREDDSDKDDAGEVEDDIDEADYGHGAGEADVVHGSGEDEDDDSDEADDGHAGEDGADVLVSDEVADDSSEDEADDGHRAGKADVIHGSGEDEDDSDNDDAGEVEDDLDEAYDVHIEGEVDDDLTDDESNMQPNKSSLTNSNRKSAGVSVYSHMEQRTRLSTQLSDGKYMKTAESFHPQSVSRPEEGSEFLETSDDESLDLAMARGAAKTVENNQLILEELLETPPYLKSIRFASADKPAPIRKKIQRAKITKPKKSGSVLTSSQVKQIFSHHAKVRVSKDAFEEVEKCLDLYMDQLASDLSAYSAHANRKTITRADMELLMKRQGLVTDTTSLNVLIEKHLPMDCRALLIPCARSGNKVLPKNVAS